MPEKNVTPPKIGVGVLIWRDQQLLLGERIAKDGSRCWQFPGGHLENNESVIACAIREVKEETGLAVKNPRHLGFTDQTFVISQQSYITLLISCDYQSGKAQTREPDKCASWQWFDYQKLPTPLFAPIEHFLSQLSNSSEKALYLQHCTAQIMPVLLSENSE